MCPALGMETFLYVYDALLCSPAIRTRIAFVIVHSQETQDKSQISRALELPIQQFCVF